MILRELPVRNGFENLLLDLEDNLLRMHSSSDSGYPGMRLQVKEDLAVVTAEIPGVLPEDVEVSVKDDILTLNFQRKSEELSAEGRVLRRERPAGKFQRSLRIPFRADASRMEARLSLGVLAITIPRAEEDKPRRIEIKA